MSDHNTPFADPLSPSPRRERVDLAQLEQAAGTVIADDRRRRPLWFDGRFLDAQALNAEQGYLLARLADYGRAAGFGVIHGLNVRRRADDGRARTLVIEAGHGITPSGAQVLLSEDLEVDLAAVPEGQRLDAGFGLAGRPKAPPYNRTGLFVLALRPVEYSAGPMTAYPASLEDRRETRDGTLVEATAVTLIPYPDGSAATELEARRSAVAREIFLGGSLKGQPEAVLPLAMLALDHGIVRWLDVHLVRREIGHREPGPWGLGSGARALRLAHIGQYRDQLEELLAAGAGGGMAAADHFRVLPPAGPLPPGAVDADSLRQRFFPVGMEVTLSLLPEDELPALVDEALRLPPIDLEAGPEAQAADAVMVLLPLPRAQFAARLATLRGGLRPLAAARPTGIAAGVPAVLRVPGAAEPADEAGDAAWRTLLAEQERLWFVRRRDLAVSGGDLGRPVVLVRDEAELESALEERIAALGLKTRFNRLLGRATRPAAAEITRLMAAPAIARGPALLTRGVVAELDGREKLDSEAVAEVAARFRRPDLGEGLGRLAKANEAFERERRLQDNLIRSGRLLELDRIAARLPEEDLAALAEKLADVGGAAGGAAPQRIAALVDEVAASLPPSRGGGEPR